MDRTSEHGETLHDEENIIDSTLSTRSTMRSSQIERKLDSALTKVPASYICNRCKGRGHYVSDCPTNEDPVYDISAGLDYVCKFCKERGTHYFLFCPKNPDPNSIYRRRQEKAFQDHLASTSHSSLALRQASTLSPEFPLISLPAWPSRPSIMVPDTSNRVNEFDQFTQKRGMGSRDMLAKDLVSIDDCDGLENGMTDIVVDDSQQKGAESQDELRESHFENIRLSEGEIVWERLKNDIQREHSKGLQQQSIAFSNPIDPERTSAAPVATIDDSLHKIFLSKLFTNHSSQANPRRRVRMTALEMWDINDRKKRREEDEFLTESRHPEHSPKDFSNHSSGDEDHTTLSKQRKQEFNLWEDRKGNENREKHQERQEESATRAEKVRNIQKRIDYIDGLRTKLVSGNDVESTDVEYGQ